MIKKTDNLLENENRHEIYIQTFGKFVIKIVKWNRKKSPELFAYLLQNREMPIHKEKLCNLLWPNLEPKKALVNLQSTIYSIRKVLREYDNCEIRIKYAGDNYILYIEKVSIDMVEFEDTLGHALDLQDITLLKNALGIYKGNYLEEQGWIWAEPRKEELRKKYMVGLKIWDDIT